MSKKSRPGDMIKVALPGETMWALVTGIGKHGQIHARLRNESVFPSFSYDDEVVLGLDGFTVVGPQAKLSEAQRHVRQAREELRSRT